MPRALAVVVERLIGCPPDVHAIEALSQSAFPSGSFSVREEVQRAWSRIWVARCALSQRATRRDLDSTPGDPAGLLLSWHVADELHILNVATAFALRRRGIATVLMKEAIGYAATHRVRLVLLEVRRSNHAALGLYRRLGFSVTALRAGYYADTGEDAIEMNLVFDPATGLILPAPDEFRVDG